MSRVWVIHGKRMEWKQPCDRDIGGCTVSFDHPQLEPLILGIRSSSVLPIDVTRLGGTNLTANINATSLQLFLLLGQVLYRTVIPT